MFDVEPVVSRPVVARDAVVDVEQYAVGIDEGWTRAGVRMWHPQLSEDEVTREVFRIFYGELRREAIVVENLFPKLREVSELPAAARRYHPA